MSGMCQGLGSDQDGAAWRDCMPTTTADPNIKFGKARRMQVPLLVRAAGIGATADWQGPPFHIRNSLTVFTAGATPSGPESSRRCRCYLT